MVSKRCHEAGCVEGTRFAAGKAATARCDHPWYIRVMVDGRRAQGPVSKFRFLLRRGEQLPASKADALELEGRVRTWMVTGATPPPDEAAVPQPAPARDEAPVRTIAAAVADYQTKHVAKMADTGAAYLAKRIADECGTRPITDLLDAGVIAEWLGDLAEDSDADDQRASSTVNRYRARWSHLITFCRIEYALAGPTPFYHPILNPTSPLRRLKEARRKRRLKAGEETRLLRGCRSQTDGGQMIGRLFCALDAGLRRREMLLVELDHLQRDRNGLSIYIPAANAKGRKERAVPVTSHRLLKFLQQRQRALRRTFGQPRGPRFVFGQADGARLDSFRTDWEAVQIAGGFRAGTYRTVDGRRLWTWTHDDDLNWHDLRHECGSRLAHGTATTPGVALRDIQEMLGHAKLATTEIYLNTSHESVARNMRRVHRALGV